MQTEPHVVGQHGQFSQGFKGSVPFSKKNLTTRWKPWHSENDLKLRREIFSHITTLVQKYGLENRLPAAIATELENALYLDADSKEDYDDLTTLERRICSLMLRLRNSQKAAQVGAIPGAAIPEATILPVNSMGYSSVGGGRVLPLNSGPRVLIGTGRASVSAPDVGSNAAIGGFNNNNNLFASSIVQQPPSGFGGLGFENKDLLPGLCMPKSGSRMIPTPGLNTEVSSNCFRSLSASDGSADKAHQQTLPVGSGRTFRLTSLQRDGPLSSNSDHSSIQMFNGLQPMRPDQIFVNHGAPLNGSSYYPSTIQGHGQASSHFSHHVNPSSVNQQYGISGADSYVSDVTDGESFQNAALPTRRNPSSFAATSINLYPNMLSENSDANLSQTLFTQLASRTGPFLNSPTSSVISQEHQQTRRASQLHYKDSETFLSNGITPSRLTSSAQDVIADMLATQQDQHQKRNQLSYIQQQSVQAMENKEQSWLDTGGNQTFLPLGLENLQKHCPSVDQHSEQTCQASSADTGQSEVVSNDDSLTPSQVKDTCIRDQFTLVKQQRWLLVMFWHVSRCSNPGQCAVARCEAGHNYWRHVITCRQNPCKCTNVKRLLRHHNKCRNKKCVICGPVRLYASPQAVAARCKLTKERIKQLVIRGASTNEAESPPVKRAKLEGVTFGAPLVSSQEVQASASKVECQDTSSFMRDRYMDSFNASKEKDDDNVCSDLPKIESPTESSVSAGSLLQEPVDTKSDQVSKLRQLSPKGDIRVPVAVPQIQQTELAIVPSKVPETIDKQSKRVGLGITYLECLTAEQIKQHIVSLRKWIGQSKQKAEKNQAMERHMSTSACSACAVEALHFDPIPIFCTQCGCRIKRNAPYYTSGSSENSLSFCGPCYNRFETLETDGFKVQKSALEKKKNDEQRVEAWVECDKCKKWQHQICALFNARINKERSEYVCPDCCIAEIEHGERVPRAMNSVLGAKDLPRTVLSDFVEERLAWKLEQERALRAKALGKCPEEISTAEGLVVRVISSVDKKLEVKPRFWEIFQQEDYPKDFVYKSKMLMLFQEIEGVEVCLFGMYVQEFGAESPQPNQRHAYLSYLDSVKYFRPDVKTVSGEALRTYVYHEILIAYLDYCKRRGFSSCYIWACPPLKGDDYILYCHPEIQKTPKTDKLREWYLSMIAKAKEEKVVTANKNLYDYYFTSNGDCKAKVTAARLPYFDGDYWPGSAEDILQQLQEEEEGIHSSRRGKLKKLATKRTTKTSAQADVYGNVSKDAQLMQKLGQSIVAMKEDFIMVHMHHACSRCRNFIISGARWFCQMCGDNFQLCESCHDEHDKLNEEEKHPAGKKDCHSLLMEEVNGVPASTLDRDEIMECEYFDNRQAFLSLCQGNQYQYDTLRRAKHSSMMILYHLHNPNAPAFISSCTICHVELEAGQGWKCKTCSDYDVCNGCFSSKDVQRHPHKFVARTVPADQSIANAADRQQRMLQLRTMLEVLAHASKCREASCQFAKCRNMKDLFRHGFSCPRRVAGGCSLCKRMWFLLTAHARSCKESSGACTVPRCTDLRKHIKRTQQQQESRRRAAVNEMMRQRAAEAAEGQ